jgi:TetR/AcrR family transcriptional regulator, transcriptional repressor for nem operon
MKTDTRKKILSAGADIVLHKGFNHTGIQEILSASEVPKGSFYFYFNSKEDFGLQLIDYYRERIAAGIEKYGKDKPDDPVSKLRYMFEWSFEVLRQNDFKGGCPIGNLSLEMADINEKFRVRLDESITVIKNRIRQLIDQAKERNGINGCLDSQMLSDFIFSSWEGTLLLMKVSKCTGPQESFLHVVFHSLLKPCPAMSGQREFET